ncbi:MAG TPA: ABC transporter permease [Thermoanaerobaculia bacterium]|jgi:putative ABC transport system permease protein|nr:ABC transporter permease [Thermoanaerobaculia bacterium]
MVFLENFRIALEAIRANKMRSILTTIGIIIGVAAVIAVVSIIQGFQYMVNREFQGVGAAFVSVSVDRQSQLRGLTARPVRLTWEDGKAIRDQVPGIRQITPVIAQPVQVKYRDLNHRPVVLGVASDYQDVTNHAVEHGRFISSVDLTHRRKVAVVGKRVVEELKLGDDPIGKKIYVGNIPAIVVGVMEDKGQILGEDRNDLVFIPFDLALNLFGRGAGEQVNLQIQAQNTGLVDEVKDGIRRVLRQRHRIPADQPDDFRVIKQDEILNSINKVLGGVTAVVSGVVGVALLVGGIGIMNIMLVSVTERTREIGVRKAVGARRKDLLLQFLIEAVTLSLVGGGIGLIAGYGMGALLVRTIPGDLPPAHVPLWAVALAFGFSTLVGVIFGIYPAGKASRLDPIDALRYE